VLHGCELAAAEGFTHVPHDGFRRAAPGDKIPEFMAASTSRPGALVLGLPIFDASAPAGARAGPQALQHVGHLETAGGGIGDSLYGMRVYPSPTSLR
jgi:hypothetical protein